MSGFKKGRFDGGRFKLHCNVEGNLMKVLYGVSVLELMFNVENSLVFVLVSCMPRF